MKSNQIKSIYWYKIQTRTGLSPMKTWSTIIYKLLSTSQEKGHCFRIFLWDWTSSLCYSELVHRIMDLLFQSTKITKYVRTHSWGQQSKMFYMESMYIYNALPLAACARELWNYLLKEKTKTAVMQQRWTMEKVSNQGLHCCYSRPLPDERKAVVIFWPMNLYKYWLSA